MATDGQSEEKRAVSAAMEYLRHINSGNTRDTPELGPMSVMWAGEFSHGARLTGYVRFRDTGLQERDGWHVFSVPLEEVATICAETRHISLDLDVLSRILIRQQTEIINQWARGMAYLQRAMQDFGRMFQPDLTGIERAVRDYLREIDTPGTKNKAPAYYAGRMDRLPHWIRRSHGG